ncbi:MAG TPA: hypothetical protein PLL10_01430 [Elusimicrobiales bacterium]|nr:hypothetical protein [Elusimicrobiales bacterium]
MRKYFSLAVATAALWGATANAAILKTDGAQNPPPTPKLVLSADAEDTILKNRIPSLPKLKTLNVENKFFMLVYSKSKAPIVRADNVLWGPTAIGGMFTQNDAADLATLWSGWLNKAGVKHAVMIDGVTCDFHLSCAGAKIKTLSGDMIKTADKTALFAAAIKAEAQLKASGAKIIAIVAEDDMAFNASARKFIIYYR